MLGPPLSDLNWSSQKFSMLDTFPNPYYNWKNWSRGIKEICPESQIVFKRTLGVWLCIDTSFQKQMLFIITWFRHFWLLCWSTEIEKPTRKKEWKRRGWNYHDKVMNLVHISADLSGRLNFGNSDYLKIISQTVILD